MAFKKNPEIKESTLDELFFIRVAKSKGVESYSPGNVPFVTSAETNNGVVAYVEPEEGDNKFDGPAITISGLGYATVHIGKFLPKGNGGDSLTVLTPRKHMKVQDLISFAAAFNVLHKWRFSYGRKCNKVRLKHLKVPECPPESDSLCDGESRHFSSINSFVDSTLDQIIKNTITQDSSGFDTNQDDIGKAPDANIGLV